MQQSTGRLYRSAALDVPDKDGNTPMHDACEEGHLKVAKWLHEKGAKVHGTTGDGVLAPLFDSMKIGKGKRVPYSQFVKLAGGWQFMEIAGGQDVHFR